MGELGAAVSEDPLYVPFVLCECVPDFDWVAV